MAAHRRSAVAVAGLVVLAIGTGAPAGQAAPVIDPPTSTRAPARPPTVATLPAEDAVPVTRPDDRLDVPAPRLFEPPPASQQRSGSAAAARYRFAVSFVVIRTKGQRLGFSKNKVRALTTRVGARMARQTNQRFSYAMRGWSLTPKVRGRTLSCDIYRLHSRYRTYAAHLRRPPRGFRDTIVVYLTPPRAACQYAGVAMLGGRATYLNGLFLADRQRLQDWILAHELGHNLGLDHSASFWPGTGTWSPEQRVPVNERSQNVNVYGDYLDVMGQPPFSRTRLRGANYSRWVLGTLSLHSLGVLGRRNVSFVTRSGNHTLKPGRPDPSGGVMSLAIPVTADGVDSYWVLEYRPSTQNVAGPRFPAPYATRGYGVRLLLTAHGGGSYPNKVFHFSGSPAAQAALPRSTAVRLGGGATVTVLSADADAAQIRVNVPE